MTELILCNKCIHFKTFFPPGDILTFSGWVNSSVSKYKFSALFSVHKLPYTFSIIQHIQWHTQKFKRALPFWLFILRQILLLMYFVGNWIKYILTPSSIRNKNGNAICMYFLGFYSKIAFDLLSVLIDLHITSSVQTTWFYKLDNELKLAMMSNIFS